LDSSLAARAVRAGLREVVAGKLAAAVIVRAGRLGLGLAAAIGLAAAVQGAEQAVPFELRAEGSFPLQYIETVRGTSRQSTLTGAPFFEVKGTAHLPSGLNASVFTGGGHNQLGSFRDGDNTFASVGGNLVKRWGALITGASFEHTHYFANVFGETTNIANDTNVFARYVWIANKDIKMTSAATLSMRLDEAFSVERYSYGTGIEVERGCSKSCGSSRRSGFAIPSMSAANPAVATRGSPSSAA